MKYLVVMICASMIGACFGASNVLVPVDNVYSPKGFDANDNSEVIVSGFLPNLCYKNRRRFMC